MQYQTINKIFKYLIIMVTFMFLLYVLWFGSYILKPTPLYNPENLVCQPKLQEQKQDTKKENGKDFKNPKIWVELLDYDGMNSLTVKEIKENGQVKVITYADIVPTKNPLVRVEGLARYLAPKTQKPAEYIKNYISNVKVVEVEYANVNSNEAYVYFDGCFFNEHLLQYGLASLDLTYDIHKDILQNANKYAKRRNLGIYNQGLLQQERSEVL